MKQSTTELPGFTSKHGLIFEVSPWILSGAGSFIMFKIGTCHGLWRSTKKSYDILAIDNEVPGNGHFEDVMEWFENSCRRDGRCLQVLEVFNSRFKKHLIEKRGFTPFGDGHVRKTFSTND